MTRIAPMAGLLLLAATTLPASAADAPTKPTGRDCFNAGNINGWTFIAPDTVRLTVGVNDHYDLKLFRRERELNFQEWVGLRIRPGATWVCDPKDIDVLGGRSAIPVPVTQITRVVEGADSTQAEAQAGSGSR